MESIEHPNWDLHASNDEHCRQCSDGFPHRCVCGGLVHGEIADIPGDGFVQLTHCDRCGEPDTT